MHKGNEDMEWILHNSYIIQPRQKANRQQSEKKHKMLSAWCPVNSEHNDIKSRTKEE